MCVCVLVYVAFRRPPVGTVLEDLIFCWILTNSLGPALPSVHSLLVLAGGKEVRGALGTGNGKPDR